MGTGNIAELRTLVDQLQRAKLEAKKWADEEAALKKEVILFLEREELDSFTATNCKVSLVHKESVAVPRDVDQKLSLFNWIREKFGQDHLNKMITINSQSFQSFYKELAEAALESGDIDFKLPGVEPYTRVTVALRKR